MQDRKYVLFLAAAVIASGLIIAVPVFAQANPGFNRGSARGTQMQGQGIAGTVSAINGNTITVTGRQGFNKTATAATTYTVDATNAKVTKNNATSTVASITIGDTIFAQGKITGTNIVATTIRDGVMTPGARNGMGVSGTVASISGTTLTITSKARSNGGALTTYTVDASSATITKNNQTSSVSNIVVGDTVMVQGTVNGTSVTAKTIRDGVAPQAQPVIQGNGQPVVAGSVSSISGNIITITNKSNVTYTVDASSTKFVVTGVASPSISNVAVGDNLLVQGAVNGNSIVASSVIDQKAKASGSENNSNKGFMGGMMNSVTNFFKHLFGF